jgi:signal transduction histidine kinase
VPHRWPDGSRHWLLIAGRVLDPGCMVGVTLDVTERRGAAEALIAADRGKDEFLAVLGHELRNPIAPILTAVTLLQKKGPADRELQKLRTTILRQTLQMSKLVDDLLDVGRIINGKLRLERRVVDLNAVVAQAIETCAPLIEQQRHTLLVTRADVPLHVDADYERMVQVVCNLLNNAAKYMADGGRIELSVHARDGHGVIRVRDEGVGLSPEMLGRIFHQFVQIDSSTCLSQGGLGVGLSIVRAIVELHGGTVEARSDGVDTGAEFTVTLPGTARA